MTSNAVQRSQRGRRDFHRGLLSLKPQLLLIVLATASYLPFIDQAFHIDDRIYLEVAHNILATPAFPYDYPPLFEGLTSPDAASHSHLPLISYYLAAVRVLTASEQEWVYHLAFLVFPFLAALGFYELAQRYVRFPGAAASLLIMAPAFYVLSHTLMTEVPLLAFWILALSRFMKVADGEGSRVDWWVCAVSLLAASFISLISAILILLMSAYWVLTRRGRGSGQGSRVVLVLLLPVLLWVLWYLFSYFHYDRFVLVNTVRHIVKRGGFSWEVVGQNGLSLVLNLGGMMLFPLALWAAFASRTKARVFALILLLSFVPFYLWVADWTVQQVFLFTLFFSSGWMVVWEAGSSLNTSLRLHILGAGSPGDSRRTGRQLLLLLWFVLILVACLFLYYAGSARYAVLLTPPVILFWMIALERRVTDRYFLRNLIWLSTVVTVGYSIVISAADYQFAEVYRRTALEIRRDFIDAETSREGSQMHRVWFTGEWGFRYYLEKAGANILPRTGTGPQEGDILVKPYVATPWVTLYDSNEYIHLLEKRDARVKSPLRILDSTSHAGFYSTGWGILPVSLTEGKSWEWFNIFQVRQAYEGAIPKEERHW